MAIPPLKSPEILSDMKFTQSPAQFPYGTRGTSVTALASAILAPHDFVAISSPEISIVNILNHLLMAGWDLCYMREMICQSPLSNG